jgi:hypothetical protein
MISHEIIKTVIKPEGQPFRWKTERFPNITNQVELDAWLKDCPFEVGDYVTYMGKLHKGDHNYAVKRIHSIQDRWDKLTFKPYGYRNPELVELVANTGHRYWDDVSGMRKLTKAEQAEYLLHNKHADV